MLNRSVSSRLTQSTLKQRLFYLSLFATPTLHLHFLIHFLDPWIPDAAADVGPESFESTTVCKLKSVIGEPFRIDPWHDPIKGLDGE